MYSKRAEETQPIPLPKPIVWPSSGKWDGNDGKWSSFTLNVGATQEDLNGGHNFRVLPFTYSSLTLLPSQQSWCNTDCAAARGVEPFKSKQPLGFVPDPATWNEKGQSELPLPSWWTGSQFNNTGNPNGTYGFGTVGLGPSSPDSPMIGDVWVVQFNSRDFFMGSFGLGIDAVKQGGVSSVSFLRTLLMNSGGLGTAYGYSAGASYKHNDRGVPGHLVLGGYDRARFIDQTANISFTPSAGSILLVGVQSIIYRPDPDVQVRSSSFTADTLTFNAAIDSTLPYLTLPEEICDRFEEEFQLDYDEDEKFYKISDSAHRYNLNQNATVTFQIGQSKDNSDRSAKIALPYAAFVMNASEPLFENSTRYFPLKRSIDGKNVLGRTFLQEAYLIVDYERATFTVAPAAWPDPAPSSTIVTILSTSYTNTSVPAPSPKNNGLAPGAIAGIVVGILAALGLIAVGVFLWWRRRRAQKPSEETLEKTSDFDTTQAGDQVKARRVSELDSEPPNSPRPSFVPTYYDPHNKDHVPFPAITEMESPPAELYSPPPPDSAAGTPGSERADYFIVGNKVRRRGATRESSGNNTPGTPGVGMIAELPGDDGKFMVDGQHFDEMASPTSSPIIPALPTHNRGQSDSTLQNNIDGVLAGSKDQQDPVDPSVTTTRDTSPGVSPVPLAHRRALRDRDGSPGISPEPGLERRPSHTRGLSDSTVQSDSTGISGPTPQEREAWEKEKDDGPRRPLSN
ncbi:acid protease [Aaosphaeria arxii CBS 175.79]|uniref:Acid protease n=1 Tax=Aaosphaeria arxii CBS 175.79 TaxID=1450172 RepID=A0A6A5X603_9PLEO|nr:acid protease [Aaosphaeria arxii CBS 175.79]KAF2008408.1 acid protease [Aaosphaeria arxii CBS 175.79]